MKKFKEVMYDNEYVFGANGFALLAIGTLVIYGGISMLIDVFELFLSK